MIANWIYGNPTWLWGSIFVFGTMALACIGLVIFHHLVDHSTRRAHNELAGFVLGLIGVVYAVLLAFIAVATWEAFSAADTMVQTEAGYIDNLYRDTHGFPEAVGAALRHQLRVYTDIVIRDEWPVQMEGEVPTAGWHELYKLHKALVTYEPATRGQAVVQAEFLRNLNELYRAREARLSAATEHVPVVIWYIILIGGAVTTGFSYLFGFENFRMHLTMTAALAGSLSLVIVLIVAMDWPLRGEVSISPEAFDNIEHGWAASAVADKNGPVAPMSPTPVVGGHQNLTDVTPIAHH